MKERIFIQSAKEHVKLEEFVRKQFANARCGTIEVQHTPVVTRIIIYTTTPGLIIGSGGERIKETIELLKKDFGIENPQIDVQRIDNPDLDPNIVAQMIAASIESNINYKRLGNYYTQRIMEAGAVGCEIIFAGKFGGQRGKKERFVAGYIKKCGEPAQTDVIKGFAKAIPKLGITGVTVKIMMKQPGMLKIKKREEPKEEASKEEQEKREEKAEELEQKEEAFESKGEEYGHR